MAVETSTPYRRVVGTLIRGVGDGLLGTPSGIPLAGAKVVAEASIRSATSDHYIAFDPVEGITDNNAVLRNAITGEPGLLLVVTDDPSVGVVDWTWHITITAPTLARPIEFDMPVPSGEGDIDLAGVVPVPGADGEVQFVWWASIEEEAIKAVDAKVAGLDVVVRTDMGAPIFGRFEGRGGAVAGDVDDLGRASRVIYKNGRQHFPRLSADSAQFGDAATFRVMQNDEYAFAIVHVASGRIGFGVPWSGGLPQWIIDRIATKLPGMGGPIVVVGILGQSNATQADNPTAEVAFDSGEKIMLWSPELGRGVPIARAAAWIGSGLAREIHARYPEQRVLIVRCSMGETGFTSTSLTPPADGHTTVPNGTWDRTLADDPKNLALQAPPRLLAARAWAQGVDSGSWLDGVVWSQGEQDRGLAQTAYAERLDDYLSWLRSEVGIADLPIAVTGFEPQWSRDPANNAGHIEAALRDTPRRLTRTAFHDGPDNLGDHSGLIHWSGEGQELRGRQLVDALVRARVNLATSEPISPQHLTVTRSGSLVEISWQAPPCRVTSYVLETSTDSGATWTPRSLAAPLALTHEVTVAANTPVWVRAAATNEVGTSEPTKVVKR